MLKDGFHGARRGFFEIRIHVLLGFAVERFAVDEDQFAVVLAFQHDVIVSFCGRRTVGSAVLIERLLLVVFAVGVLPASGGLRGLSGNGACDEFGGAGGADWAARDRPRVPQ